MKRSLLPIFDEFNELYRLMNSSDSCSRATCQPKGGEVSISEDEHNLYVDVPMPGCKSEDVSVTLDPKKRTLSICGQAENKREGVRYHIKGSECYCYEIPLSNEIDFESSVDAVSREGLLMVTLPKSRSHKPKKIEVRVA